jgi:hypothetical protein
VLHFGFDFDEHAFAAAAAGSWGGGDIAQHARREAAAQNDGADGSFEMGLFVGRRKSAQQGHQYARR